MRMSLTFSDQPDTMDSDGLPFISTGNPKVVLYAVGAANMRLVEDGYKQTKMWPHFTLDLDDRSVRQHTPLTKACTLFSPNVVAAPHRRSESYWVAVNRNSGTPFSEDEKSFIKNFLMNLVVEVGADVNVSDYPRSPKNAKKMELGVDLWESFSGIVSAAIVPKTNWPSAVPLDFLQDGDTPLPDKTEVVEEIDDLELDALGEFKGRSVSLGSSGKKVDSLRDFFKLEPGDFDSHLETLVVAIQDTLGLEPNGVVDGDTWNGIASLEGA